MRYAIAVGSNRGDRAGTLTKAAGMLIADRKIKLCQRSGLLENPAVGGPHGQDDFLNGAWMVETGYGPHQLLARLQKVENALGRNRAVADGPRTCDLDLLLADQPLVVDSAVLRLPHPRMCERAFVLAPLAEVAPDWVHPITRLRIDELWRRLRAQV